MDVMSSMRWQTEGFDVPQGVSLGCFVLAKSIAIQIFIFPPNALQCERRERAHAIAEIPQNSTPHRIPRKHSAMFVSATSNDARSSGVTLASMYDVCMRWSFYTSRLELHRASKAGSFSGPVWSRLCQEAAGGGGKGVREKSTVR